MDCDVLNVYIISDSTGATAETFVKSVITHFPNVNFEVNRKFNIDSENKINKIVEKIPEDSIIIQTIAEKKLEEYLKQKAKKENIKVIDILGPALSLFEEVTGQKALREKKLTRKLSDDYFSMIESIEFAVKYDDGKDPRGVARADITIIGVSRTSKTPLSMYLANKHYKVCNIPLVPESPVPKELFEIEPKRVIGLTNSPDKLNKIRKERLKSMGLPTESTYSDLGRILDELDYAEKVMKKIGCPIINVSDRAIEETAEVIIRHLKKMND